MICPTASACIIHGAAREEVDRWNAAVEATVSLASPGKTLIEAGAPADAVARVKSFLRPIRQALDA